MRAPKALRHALLLAWALSATVGVHAQKARPEQAEAVTWPSMLCARGTCERMEGRGFLFATPGATKAVLISHGSQGIDSRMYDYVDALAEAGFAALVIDHWKPRGVDVTHNDYAAASTKGANEYNMAADSHTAADFLRKRGYAKIGSIGESQGGAAAVMLQQKFMLAVVDRNIRRIYGGAFEAKPIDAVVGLYPFCGYRNAKRDAYVGTPFLFVTGEVDDETPSKFCERHVGWMNERGGNARIVVLPGEGHSFDAPYRRRRSLFMPHYAQCDILVDDSGITELVSGHKQPGEDVAGMLARCLRKDGYHTGWWKDRFIAVPHWIGFFRQNL